MDNKESCYYDYYILKFLSNIKYNVIIDSLVLLNVLIINQ